MINTRDQNYLKKFGKHLKKLREEKGMSQEELANCADVSLPQITRIERGVVNPTLCTIKALANGLEIKTNGLFDFEN
ncbi:helix-turn-helix domain-containing protein [Flavobacterium aciduliphilum]|uniref:helix-turn-helix domain-containing protein n=1 Tax=Flavobacterium aciduliphilum TaxID=1101402 RepID=UPI001FEB4618|nr:helix-turn-helix transcriptional regulator [Flavobacterium aciduliphilum]